MQSGIQKKSVIPAKLVPAKAGSRNGAVQSRKWGTAKEAAAQTGKSLSTVYRWSRTGKIRARKCRNGRWKIYLPSARAWAEKSRKGRVPHPEGNATEITK